MDADHDAADLASWLRGARGRLTARGGLGVRYAARDVDAFLSGVAADLGRGVLPGPESVRAVTFRITRMGAGYQEREVDDLLRGLERRLGEAAGTGVPASPDPDMEPLVARLTSALFRTVRRNGYDEREVDDFLDNTVQALRRGQPAAPPSGFTTARLRPGYSKQDVDAMMSEVWPEWGRDA